MNFTDRLERKFPKFFRVHLLQDRRRPNEMVRNFRQGRRVRLRGQQIKPAINLKRVGVDNFGIELAGNLSSGFRLASRGRPNDEKNVVDKKTRVARLNKVFNSSLHLEEKFVI